MKQKKNLLLATILTSLLVLPTLAQTFTYGDRLIKTVTIDGKSVDLNRATDNITKKFGIVDKKTGNVLIPFVWDYLMFSAEDEIFECKDYTKKESEYLNFQCKSLYKGKTYQFPKTHFGDEIAKNYAIYCTEEFGLMGLINPAGKTVVPCEYKRIKLKNSDKDIWELTKTDGSTSEFNGKTQQMVIAGKNEKNTDTSYYKPVNLTIEQLVNAGGYWYQVARYNKDYSVFNELDLEGGTFDRFRFYQDGSGAKKLFNKVLKKSLVSVSIKHVYGPKHFLKGIENVIFEYEFVSLEGRNLIIKNKANKKQETYLITEYVPNVKLVMAPCIDCFPSIYVYKSN